MHIYYKNRRSIGISAVTNYWLVDNRWKPSPIHRIMGLAYLLIVTCRNESNTYMVSGRLIDKINELSTEWSLFEVYSIYRARVTVLNVLGG